MRDIRLKTSAALVCLGFAGVVRAQQSQPTATVPKPVRFSGSFHPVNGTAAQPVAAQVVESLTLSVYRDQVGGTALWQETQNVAVDGEGKYSVLMGSTQNEGIPIDLFNSGDPRWLGVQFNRPGEAEQPRVLMTSVPYALKSVDAETLGGRPASAYLLAGAVERGAFRFMIRSSLQGATALLIAAAAMAAWIPVLVWLLIEHQYRVAVAFAAVPWLLLWGWYGRGLRSLAAVGLPVAIYAALPILGSGLWAALKVGAVDWKGRTIGRA